MTNSQKSVTDERPEQLADVDENDAVEVEIESRDEPLTGRVEDISAERSRFGGYIALWLDSSEGSVEIRSKYSLGSWDQPEASVECSDDGSPTPSYDNLGSVESVDVVEQDVDGEIGQDDDQPAAEFVGAPEGQSTGFRYETPDGDAVEIRQTGRESALVLTGAENLTDDVREAIARDRGILNFDTDADAVSADGGDEIDQDDDQGEAEVEPTDVASEPTEPDVAQYILDGLDRQDPTELRAIAEYADALADYRDAQIEAEAPTPDEPDRLADAVDELAEVDSNDDEQQDRRQELLFEAWDAGGTVQRKKIPCGDNCDGCPHGPYLYLTYRDGDTVRSKYLGKPGNYGVEQAGQSPESDDQDDDQDGDESSNETVDLAEFVDDWEIDQDVATDGGWSQ